MERSTMAWVVGTRVGAYEIVEEIGAGGMATIYKALQPSLQRHVAIKVLRLHGTKEPALVARFRREAAALAALRHPNIIYLHDFGEHEGDLYLVMEHVPNGTLRDWLAGPIPPVAAGRIVAQIASALDYAHELGILHRDIKPANILLQRAGWALLSDFGIAKIMSDPDLTGITRTGAFFGTPEYLCPDQALNLEPDQRLDVYALGLVTYEMLTGVVPFQGATALLVALKHLNDPPPPPRALNPAVPPALEAVVLRALAKDRDERYARAGEFAAAFQAALGVGAFDGPVPAAWSPPRPSHYRHPSDAPTLLTRRSGMRLLTPVGERHETCPGCYTFDPDRKDRFCPRCSRLLVIAPSPAS
jgi:serine/threonine protein kinase